MDIFLINEIRTSLDWIVVIINALGDGDGVISDCFRIFYLFSVNSSKQVIFLFLHVVAMLENIVTALVVGWPSCIHFLFVWG